MQLFVADQHPYFGGNMYPFPTSVVSRLEDGAGVDLGTLFANKLTLVTVSFQAFGKQQSDQWHAPFMNAFGIGGPSPTRGVQVSVARSSPTSPCRFCVFFFWAPCVCVLFAAGVSLFASAVVCFCCHLFLRVFATATVGCC